MIESHYSDRRFRRNEVVAALLVALAFHGLLLCGFKVDRPAVKVPETALPPVRLWDFDAMPEVWREELAGYLAGSDPAAFAAGSQNTGFSYVMRTPDFRAALPPPEYREVESAPPSPTPETGVKLKLVAPVGDRLPLPLCSAALLSGRTEGKVDFPLIDVDGVPEKCEFPAELRPMLEKTAAAESNILISFGADGGLPRITVLRGCGVPELENWAVGAVLRSDKSGGRRQINVRWRKE